MSWAFQLIFYVWLSMLWCYAIVSEKGRRFGTIKTFNLATNVCTCPKSGIWCTVVVVCLYNLHVFFVSRFLYRLNRWFSRLNWFYTSNFRALYSFLFGVSQGSVLKAVHWPIIMVYFFFFIVIWMESCLIGTHITSSYIYILASYQFLRSVCGQIAEFNITICVYVPNNISIWTKYVLYFKKKKKFYDHYWFVDLGNLEINCKARRQLFNK